MTAERARRLAAAKAERRAAVANRSKWWDNLRRTARLLRAIRAVAKRGERKIATFTMTPRARARLEKLGYRVGPTEGSGVAVIEW